MLLESLNGEKMTVVGSGKKAEIIIKLDDKEHHVKLDGTTITFDSKNASSVPAKRKTMQIKKPEGAKKARQPKKDLKSVTVVNMDPDVKSIDGADEEEPEMETMENQ